MTQQPNFPWSWMLTVERRLLKLEIGRKTTARDARRQTWKPRDWMLAASGLAILVAALAEKVEWISAFALVSRLYGGR